MFPLTVAVDCAKSATQMPTTPTSVSSSSAIKAVIFDADGTLLDSLGPHVDFCHAMNDKYCDGKLPLPPRDQGKQSLLALFLLRSCAGDERIGTKRKQHKQTVLTFCSLLTMSQGNPFTPHQ